jgi:hypothetical protein
MIPSECGCSRIAAEAAKVDLGWLLNAALQAKSHQDRLSTATLAGRVLAPSAQIQTPALQAMAAQFLTGARRQLI